MSHVRHLREFGVTGGIRVLNKGLVLYNSRSRSL